MRVLVYTYSEDFDDLFVNWLLTWIPSQRVVLIMDLYDSKQLEYYIALLSGETAKNRINAWLMKKGMEGKLTAMHVEEIKY